MFPQVIFYALLGGFLPAVLWLWFWLREDSAHPEPRGLIVVTFIAGALSVFFVLPVQYILHYYLNESLYLTFFFLAGVEEFFKFVAAYIVAIRSKEDDEPIDVVIYMVTAALGFTAVENALFLLEPLLGGSVVDSVISGNLRFVGASLLHIMSSATVGLFLAFAFYKSRLTRHNAVVFGLITATILHTLFNLSIISDDGSNTFLTFAILWLSVVGLLLFFEKIKRLDQVKTL